MAALLDELRSAGLTFIYSTQLVPADLRIAAEPAARTPLDLAREVLAAHELGLSEIAPGIYSVVRAKTARRSSIQTRADAPPAAEQPRIEELVVLTSRYALAADTIAAPTFLTQEQLSSMPRLADETLRALQRLPGVSTNGFSSLGSVRGGEPGETAIVLDGLRLYEPFHLKHFLSPVSLLDSRWIGSIEFYSGGFPALHGDRMSAIVDAESVRIAAPRYLELGLNLFHTSALGATTFDEDRGQLLLSARRSNVGDLARYAENDFGEPHYSDAFARADYRVSETTELALNMLASRDSIRATQSSGTQRARAEYRNAYVWATLDHDWSPHAESRLILSYTDLDNRRHGEVDDPGARRGTVRDLRAFHILGARLENTLASNTIEHRFGTEVRRLWGKYDYASFIRLEPDFPFPGSPAFERAHAARPKPDGFETSAYYDVRLPLGERWTLQTGLRFDTQTYDGSDDGEQWSPRVGLLYEPGERTRLRASWGRFHQSHGINELQVEDGVDRFHPAQYADHTILSLDHELASGFDLRIEAYRKDYHQPSPRFENLFDPLVLFPEAELDRVRVDAASARAEGIELMLRMRPRRGLSGWLGYAWSRVEDRIDGRDVPRSWDQRHAVNLGLVWSSGPWTASLANTYRSAWPTTRLEVSYDEGAPQLVTERRNRARLANFNTLDLRVTRTFELPRGSLDLFVELTNALDRVNPCCVEYQIERATDGTLRYTRERDPWLPLVPSAGVLWRFGDASD